MEKIYVAGHRKPDTDSISSAIALSYLKNKLGMNTIPVALSDINLETKFALDYFNVEEPMFLNDVKVKIKDVNYKTNYFIDGNESIFKGYNLMQEENLSKIPVVDNNQNFIGVLGMKDIAKDQIEGNFKKLNSTYENILATLKGVEVLKFNENIEGNIVIASLKSTTFMETVELDKDDILIIGDRHSLIEYAVNSSVKLIILTGDSHIKEEHIEIAKKNKVNIIKTSYLTLRTSKLISLTNSINSITSTNRILCVDINDNVSDFIEIANKTKYSYYPVIDKENVCHGLVRLSDLNEKRKKQVILVDHNSISQSIEGIEEAEILEIVDHHNIGNIATSLPINFRNMTVGSTNTIVYQMFKENNIEIPANIAGMMLSGILSDTLILKSPTTTSLDETTLVELSKIAGIDYKEYGLKMIKAGASLKGKNKEDIIYQDFKVYPLGSSKMGIGQISTTNPEDVLDELNEYSSIVENIAFNNNYDLVAFFVTDILTNGSYVLYNKNSEGIIKNSFNLSDIKQGSYLQDVVSRKLQVIPAILDNSDSK